MSKCVKLSDYLDLSYLKSNYIVLNKYINSRLRRYEKIGKKRAFYLKEIIKMLEENDDKLNQAEYIANLKTKIELLLVKEDERSYYKYILDLLEKDNLTEDDIISSIAFIDNKKYILKKLVSKADNILSFNNMTLNIIKDRINDDSFIDEIINEEKRNKAEKIAVLLENINDDNIDLNFLQTNYSELLEILKTTTLDIKVIEIIITGMNKNIDKIKSNYFDYKDLINTLEEISNIIKTNPINKITNDVINNSLNIDLGRTFNSPLKYSESNTSFIFQDTPIIALDKQVSLDLDSAFSIDKDNDLYFFDVYVTDVPSFLSIRKVRLKAAEAKVIPT